MANYMRNWEMNIYSITSDSGKPYVLGRSHTLTELRITFNIRNSDWNDPSVAQFQIYNLSPVAKALFERGRTYVEFNAGYTGDALANLFSGEVTNAYELRQDTDLVYNVTARDSQKDLETFQPEIASFSTEVSRETILNLLIDEAPNLKGIKYTGDTYNTLTSSNSLPDYTCEGTFGEELYELLITIQLRPYIKNGYVYILSDEEDTQEYVSDIPPFDVNKNTGLLTRPNLDYIGMKFDHLLNAKFYPGRLINLDPETYTRDLGNEFYVQQDQLSVQVSGLFRIFRSTHKGDTRGNEWVSVVESINTQTGD